MSEPTSDSIEISSEQNQVVSLPVACRALVVAGAGSGKTRVLASRVAQLAERDDIGFGDVLVLSFTRAVVSEMKNRLGRLPAAPMTFDAFASSLLAEFSDDPDWMRQGYDERIAAATKVLAGVSEARASLKALKHVFVDEVQDLTGIRLEFVKQLIALLDGGWTLFGDPAQRIYEYAEEEGAAEDIFDWLRRSFLLEEFHWTSNYRAKTPVTRSVLTFGSRLQTRSTDPASIEQDLRTFVLTLPAISHLKNATPMLKQVKGRSTAILCRTNGQALLIAAALAECAVPYRLKRLASEAAAPVWVAAGVRGLESHVVGKQRMVAALTSYSGDGLDAEAAWRLLKRIDPGRPDELDLRAVRSRILAGTLPEELSEGEGDGVVVSTIHRAKGLQFDRVILVDPFARVWAGDIDEELRVTYVALTRARSELYITPDPGTKGLRTYPWLEGRWIRERFRGKSRTLEAFEIRGEDIEGTEPAGGIVLTDCDVASTQEYLLTAVRTGDPVDLFRVEASSEVGITFAVHHHGRSVGVTSRRFADIFGRALKYLRTDPPEKISGLRVDVVDTVVGHESVSRAHGLGECGMWARVRVVGLGELSTST